MSSRLKVGIGYMTYYGRLYFVGEDDIGMLYFTDYDGKTLYPIEPDFPPKQEFQYDTLPKDVLATLRKQKKYLGGKRRKASRKASRRTRKRR
jgi:hypothetical protein